MYWDSSEGEGGHMNTAINCENFLRPKNNICFLEAWNFLNLPTISANEDEDALAEISLLLLPGS